MKKLKLIEKGLSYFGYIFAPATLLFSILWYLNPIDQIYEPIIAIFGSVSAIFIIVMQILHKRIEILEKIDRKLIDNRLSNLGAQLTRLMDMNAFSLVSDEVKDAYRHAINLFNEDYSRNDIHRSLVYIGYDIELVRAILDTLYGKDTYHSYPE